MQEEKLRKGPWLKEEDEGLAATIAVMGERRWDSIAKASGLRRSGKSCRLRWLNYLRPNLKRGRLSADEERIVLQLHEQWGNKWSKIAQTLPGRTDNEIKNYWRSHLRKKEQGDKNIMNDGKPEILIPKGEKTDFISNNGDCASLNHDPFRTSDDSFGLCGLSSYAIASSPYENRLSDWIPGWSDEQSGLKNHGDCLDSGFFYPVWNSENSDNGLWESSGFLWQTD